MDNMTPAPGTPAAILATYQATNPLKNQTWAVAKKFADLYNGLNVPDLKVVDIVAIQEVNGPGEAQTTPFGVLRGYGIKETDYLYLHLKRMRGGEPQYECVGDAVLLCKSVGNDANGQPNYYQQLINLIQATNTPYGDDFDDSEAPALLLNVPSVMKAANDFISSALA